MDTKSYIDYLVNWLKIKLETTQTKGFALGLSGGIDSAVCAALIKKATDNCICLILPIKSSRVDVDDAWELAKKFDIKTIEIDLTNEHKSLYNKVLGHLQDKEFSYSSDINRLSDANLRARLRMSAIYTVANLNNYLVVGTDNAAEIHTGYFTKFGDGACDILPLANLLKSQVYELATQLGVTSNILNKKPSAGLWENQTDEAEMGTTYACIDDYLQGRTIADKDLQIIEKLHSRTQHKRELPDRPSK